MVFLKRAYFVQAKSSGTDFISKPNVELLAYRTIELRQYVSVIPPVLLIVRYYQLGLKSKACLPGLLQLFLVLRFVNSDH
jgi:hypothetical protein